MSVTFSVIVPSYNRARFLPFTLESILRQQLPAVEVIVADDGSTDNTAEVVERYGNRVRLLQLRNGGAAAARHAGVLASTGKLIAFCDSDDVWRPNHLLALSDVLEASQAPFAFSNFVHIKDDVWGGVDKFASAPPDYWGGTNRLLNAEAAVADAPLFPSVLEFQPIFSSCTAMTRLFYDLVGGYNPHFGRMPSEDLEFTLRCVCKAPAGIVLQPTVGIRKHSGNHSANGSKQLGGEIDILEFSRKNHAIDPAWAIFIDRQVAKRAVLGFDSAFAANDLSLARHLASRIPLRSRSLKLWVKLAISALPDAVAIPLSGRLAGSR
jgi:glycosyltransferase involved in cell wall biosynthesis